MGSRSQVRVRGRNYPVIGRLTLYGREHLLLERLSGQRERYRAFDVAARDFRAIYILPRGQAARQHLGVLKRLAQGNPNFPTWLEHEFQAKRIVLLFTWVDGVNLRTLLQDARQNPRRWPSPFVAFRIFKGLAHGVTQLHRHAGCVHGDLKPANLLLARSPERVIILDFGSTWTLEETTRRVAGDGQSDPYASPEQHQGQLAVDYRSDQFSVAAIAYELLTGELPYDHMGGRAGSKEFIESFRTTLVPPSQKVGRPQGLPRHVWPNLDALVLRSLALDPNQRFLDPREWLAGIDSIHAELGRSHQFNPVHHLFLKTLNKLTGWFRSSPTAD